MSTFDDDSVVLALDAPRGVGAPMPDRIGMMVYPSGAADLTLIDNKTRAVAKLYSDGDGDGGVQVFQWDHDAGIIRVKTLSYDGERIDEHQMGDGN
jgi:hypothetical protein